MGAGGVPPYRRGGRKSRRGTFGWNSMVVRGGQEENEVVVVNNRRIREGTRVD